MKREMEAGVGIEPASTALQAAASPLCHPARAIHDIMKTPRLDSGLMGNHKPAPVLSRGHPCSGYKFGAGNETRTRDIHVGNVTLYQLSYSRTIHHYTCRPWRHFIDFDIHRPRLPWLSVRRETDTLGVCFSFRLTQLSYSRSIHFRTCPPWRHFIVFDIHRPRLP